MVRVFFSYKMMKDYIIVGSGLAGIAFAETLLQHNKSFVVFENQSQNSMKFKVEQNEKPKNVLMSLCFMYIKKCLFE